MNLYSQFLFSTVMCFGLNYLLWSYGAVLNEGGQVCVKLVLY